MATPYLLPADLRSVKPLDDEDAFPDARLAQLVGVYESRAEDYRGVAFTPRTATQTVWLGYCARTTLLLSWPKVRSITSVTVDGTLVSPSSYELTDVGAIYSASGFYGRAVVVVYEHGFDAPLSLTWVGAADLLEGCRQYVRSKAVLDRSQVSRDAISIAGPEGGTTSYSTPNAAQGRPTGFLTVDESLNSLPDFRVPGIG